MSPELREVLGKRVREVWIAWAREQPSPKAAWLDEWQFLSEPDKEVDRRIGEVLYELGRGAADAHKVPFHDELVQTLEMAQSFINGL